MSKEVDFITTIGNLKEIVKEAEAAMENPIHGHFLFTIPKLLRNTGGEGGFGQHEEMCDLFVGEINLNRERLMKKEGMLNLSNEAGEIKEVAEPEAGCKHENWENKLGREQKLRNAIGDLICILTGFSTNELTTKLKFSSSEYGEFISRLLKLGGFDENTKLVPADKIVEACCGTLSEEMREHVGKYHTDEEPLVVCPGCKVRVKKLWIPFSVNPDLDIPRCMLCIETARRK